MWGHGPGKGWSHNDEESVAEVYSVSSGKVSSSPAFDNADYDSTFYRMRAKHYSPNLLPVAGVDYKHYIGEGFDSDLDGITDVLMKRDLQKNLPMTTHFNEIVGEGDTLYRRFYKTGDPTWMTGTEFSEELKSDGVT
jgi:hypothetical protein|tara:strand:- start:126 stop:536 length:411 start_codon:yes stop_codon:yes gene_type:complete